MSASNSDSKRTLVIGNTIAELEKVVEFVDNFCVANKAPQGIANDLNLCLDELLSNTVSYGYEDQTPHSIVVTLSIASDSLIVEIQDDGRPFDPRDKASAPIEDTLQSRNAGGLGLNFVRALMDEIRYERKGQYNILSVRKKFAKE